MGIQLDLYDEGISEVYVLTKKLSSHKVKMYKICAKHNCKEEILNKPNKHFCWIHIIEIVQNTQDLRDYAKITCNC